MPDLPEKMEQNKQYKTTQPPRCERTTVVYMCHTFWLEKILHKIVLCKKTDAMLHNNISRAFCKRL